MERPYEFYPACESPNRLARESDVDTQLLQWLKDAYELSQ